MRGVRRGVAGQPDHADRRQGVPIAADEVIEKVKNVAAGLLEAAVGDLEVAEGAVRVKGVPGKSLPLAEVAVAALYTVGPIQGTGSFVTPFPDFNPGCATGLMLPSFPTPTYHVHVAEVEVDPVTGTVRVLRYLVAQEVGAVISPDGTYGQVMGGVTQGIGYALHESLRIGEDGRYRERTLESYRLPLAGDVPRVEFFPLGTPTPTARTAPREWGRALYCCPPRSSPTR